MIPSIKELDAVTIEYAMRVMEKDVITSEEFKQVVALYSNPVSVINIPCSAASINTQGLSKAYVVASCAVQECDTVYSDFSGKKQRSVVLKDFPFRKNSFLIWYKNNQKPYQHLLIYDRINAMLGKIGSFTAMTSHPIGYCAEQNVANRLFLDSNDNTAILKIRFSKAVRPLTGELVPYCDNCKTVFGQLKDEKI